ncbi:MAG: hypothetical protein IIV58_02345 [Alistipes sp.]|nr:hypothetical protein [Alistipes sp.]
MRRFLTIMFCFALYLVWGVSEPALSEKTAQNTIVESLSAAGNNTADRVKHPSQSIEQCQALLTLNTSRNNAVNNSPTAKSQSSTSRVVLRQKVEAEKIMSAAIHLRHAGHITHIFEYNCFRSSLRVVYYLYTLCRLRI